MIGAN